MRKISLAAALFFLLGLFVPDCADAQVQAPVSPAAPPGATLEERYIQCISSALCPLQIRLQIVQEETNEMNVHFQKVFETCAARGFQDCTDMQKADMDQWHRADYRAGQMMLSIEAQSLALKEAAAGDANRQAANQKDAGQKKTLWQRLWGK